MSKEREQPAIGASVGKYEILATLGKGEIAEIYRARDPKDDSLVLLRLLSPGASESPLFQKRFSEIESDRDRFPDDSRVLRLLDTGRHEGRCYMVYEYFEGWRLDAFLRDRGATLRLDERLAILRQTAKGLSAFHENGITHGDVKPANILVGRDATGRIRVKLAPTDMVTAHSDAMVSIYGEVVGTPHYVSPEQANGKPPDARSDIFCLGLTAFELLTGRKPFDAPTAVAYMRAISEQDAPDAQQFDPFLPPELNRMVAKMLSRDPARRYNDCRSVLDDLDQVEALLAGGPTPSASPATGARATSSDRGWRVVAILAIVACAALLVALGALIATLRQRPTPTPTTPEAPIVVPETPMTVSIGEEFDEVCARAEESRTEGNWDEAAALLAAFEAAHPRTREASAAREIHASILCDKAAADANAGKYAAALDAYRKVISRFRETRSAKIAGENAPPVLHRWAVAQTRAKDYASASALIERLEREYPGSADAAAAARETPRVCLEWAQSLADSDKPQEASEKLEEVIRRYPEAAGVARARLPDALLLWSDKLLAAGDYAGAARVRSRLVEVTRGTPRAAKAGEARAELLARWANDLAAKDDLFGAFERWSALLKEYPKSPSAAGDPTLDLLVKVGEQARATASKEGKELTEPALLKAWADRLVADGKRDEGLAWYRKLTERHPNSKEAEQARQTLGDEDTSGITKLINDGRLAEGIAAMRELVRKQPGIPAAKIVADELKRWDATPAGMVYVPAGPFQMGIGADEQQDLAREHAIRGELSRTLFADEGPGQTVRLNAFYIDKDEVTNAEYGKFTDETGHVAPPSGAWDGRKLRRGMEDHPVTNVSLDDAAAFAAWAGKRLPTEAEWEKAARGPNGRLYPWGKTFEAGRCNIMSGSRATVAVGQFAEGSSIYGCRDMIGNVWEWTTSPYAPYAGNKSGPLFDERKRVLRGGSWQEKEPYLATCATRLSVPPETVSPAVGFRCVKDVGAR